MDDDKIKVLLSGFEPEISPSAQFMAKMQRNLDAIEFVKEQNVALRKRNRRAVAIAAACGFAAGVIQTLLFPVIGEWLSGLEVSLPAAEAYSLSQVYRIVSWIIMAGICIITSIGAYRSALASRVRISNPKSRIKI